MIRRAAAVGLLLAGCAPTRPPQPSGPSTATFERAPTPNGPQPRRTGTVGALEQPLPPKMPLGTGAVPVGGGAVRGSVVTGIRTAF